MDTPRGRACTEPAITALRTLEEVIHWGLAQRPTPSEVLEVVVQDEYCHDVVMSWREGQILVFDTT